MKKFCALTLFLLAFVPDLTYAQQYTGVGFQPRNFTPYKNHITVSSGMWLVGGGKTDMPTQFNIQTLALIPAIEYGYYLSKFISVGGRFAYGLNPYEGEDYALMGSGAAWFHLRVYREWLYFRIGMELGVGHIADWRQDYNRLTKRHKSWFDKYTYLYGNIDLVWVVRLSDRVELHFAPLILFPSRFEITLAPRERERNNTDLFRFGVGIRF